MQKIGDFQAFILPYTGEIAPLSLTPLTLISTVLVIAAHIPRRCPDGRRDKELITGSITRILCGMVAGGGIGGHEGRLS